MRVQKAEGHDRRQWVEAPCKTNYSRKREPHLEQTIDLPNGPARIRQVVRSLLFMAHQELAARVLS